MTADRNRLEAPAAPSRPTAEDIAAAAGKSVPDVVAPGLKVLFCGINPGLYSGATGHHFSRPGNRFWRALHESGFTSERLTPWRERELLAYGLGITNYVNRATSTADQLASAELVRGARALERKVRRLKPGMVAFLGLGAYRVAWGRPDATVGRQLQAIGGTGIWLLPNPSGLNAHYRPPELARLFGELRRAVE
jgi:TDG/mug DNA glycosylase family protein